MSYSELVKELALDGRVIAVTRVNAADEEIDHIAGCVYKSLKKVMAGQTLVLDRSSCSCNGFVHNAGFSDERPRIPGGFGVFLSHGRIRCGLRPVRNLNAIRLQQKPCLMDFRRM